MILLALFVAAGSLVLGVHVYRQGRREEYQMPTPELYKLVREQQIVSVRITD